MSRTRLILWICILLSAVFMSIPWLVPHCGFFALFGLVPLLIADDIADRHGMRRSWLMIYLCFVLWNAATTWWVKNATVGGAVFAVLANALQMGVIWWAFRQFKRRVAGVLPYIFLAVLWIAWEKWYLQSAEISWPWLVLGNAFAQSTRSVQWYEITGSLGGSLWVWTANISIFWMLRSLTGEPMKPWIRKALPAWTLAVIAFPYAASAYIWHNFEEDSEGALPVVIAQPNFDPYEKFEAMSQAEQTEVLLSLYEEALQGDGDWKGLLIAPETFTGDVFLDDIASGHTFRRFQTFLKRHPGAGLLFGASTYDIYRDRHSKPHILARRFGNGWVVNHNSAILTDTSGRADVFHKSKLVVGTELTPYPKIFVPIDDKLGGVMGRCVGQEHIACVRHLKYDAEGGRECVMVGVPVCYESVYGEYCTGYVKMGARMLAVITNDAWWGDTPGYKQHLSYSCLRAIETRRDIARCANTGISAIIDQRGEILSSTGWWQRCTLTGEVNLSSRTTFFVRHGDLVGLACVILTLLFALFWCTLIVTRKKLVNHAGNPCEIPRSRI